MWGILCTFVVKVIHPLIMKLIDGMPHTLGVIFLLIISVAFFVDLVVTIMAICKFKKQLKLMDELAEKIKAFSNEVGINIYEGVTSALDKEEQFKENVEEKVAQAKEISKERVALRKEASLEKMQAFKKKSQELEELKIKYKKIFDNKRFSYTRIVKAFPKLEKGKYKEYLSKMKKIYKK